MHPVAIWDTGDPDHDDHHQQMIEDRRSHGEVSAFIVCVPLSELYAADAEERLKNSWWRKERDNVAPRTPFVLVGTKSDDLGNQPRSFPDDFTKRVGAYSCVTCTAKHAIEVTQRLDVAQSCALRAATTSRFDEFDRSVYPPSLGGDRDLELFEMEYLSNVREVVYQAFQAALYGWDSAPRDQCCAIM